MSSRSVPGPVQLAMKICVPGQRDYDSDDYRSQSECDKDDLEQVLKETRLYEGKLRGLQGTVVPHFYGLWRAVIHATDEVIYMMFLELVEDTITTHLVPGGR